MTRILSCNRYFFINLPGYFLLDTVGVTPLTIDDHGWLQHVPHVKSPNFEARPKSCDVRLIVVHGISLPPGQFGGGHVQQLFTNRLDPDAHDYFRQIEGLKVSAHCLIERNGVLTQFVSFHDRAWHAGVSCWHEQDNCNDFSIGIELEGSDDAPYEPAQYAQLARLVIALRKQYPAITEQAICGHSDIAPGRKTDPGPFFDWQLLSRKISEFQTQPDKYS
jgi:AmpD protein